MIHFLIIALLSFPVFSHVPCPVLWKAKNSTGRTLKAGDSTNWNQKDGSSVIGENGKLKAAERCAINAVCTFATLEDVRTESVCLALLKNDKYLKYYLDSGIMRDI